MSAITPAVLARLQEFDTPTICNIIELFDVRPRTEGFMNSSIKGGLPGDEAGGGLRLDAHLPHQLRPAHGGRRLRRAGRPDPRLRRAGRARRSWCFRTSTDPPLAATFGEVMCTSYQTFGAVGLITSGPGRDLDQVRDIGFPVFTNSANCSHGYITMSAVHAPVHVGGLAVYANDLLHGDLNGVTNIPKEIAVEVAEIGDEFVACERVVLDALGQDGLTLAPVRGGAGGVGRR